MLYSALMMETVDAKQNANPARLRHTNANYATSLTYR